MNALRVLIAPLILLGYTLPASAAPRVVVLDLHDTIQPASLRYVERGLRHAADNHAALVIIELDTPGGVLASTRKMTSAILASRVPVAIHVAPSGARAASAGFFLLLAADVAAMASGTNTGAAHPVTIGTRGDKEKLDTSLEKAAQDAAALARAIAERRQRSVEAAERAVTSSSSYTAEEARAHGLIDVIAGDREQLLKLLDGRTITRFDGRKQTLAVRGAEVAPLERTIAERVLSVIASPQVAYLLLMFGMIGLIIEMTSPGLVVPGIAGGVSLLLGIYGLSVLPVTLVGALLIAVGLALLVAEVFVASYGALAIAGLASFVAGSLMLVDAPVPELSIGPEVVVPVAIVLAILVAFLALRGAGSRRLRVRTGIAAMIGEHGSAVSPIDPEREGKVFVHGEYWNATSAEVVPEGASIRVDAIDGFRLRVSPDGRIASQGGTS